MTPALLVALLPGALLLGTLVYVVVSFLLAAPHQAPRPLSASLRAGLREWGWATLLGPLLPCFYVLGRRWGHGQGTVPVVLVHGYTQTRADFLCLARRLRRCRVGAIYGFNYNWAKSIDLSSADLGRFVAQVLSETGASQVDLVCHSQGGLLARALLAHTPGIGVRRVVTLGSPHHGVVFKGPLVGESGRQMRVGSAFLVALAQKQIPVPFLSLLSTHDNIVHPPTTSSVTAQGGQDAVVGDCGHLTLMFDGPTLDRMASFLETP